MSNKTQTTSVSSQQTTTTPLTETNSRNEQQERIKEIRELEKLLRAGQFEDQFDLLPLDTSMNRCASLPNLRTPETPQFSHTNITGNKSNWKTPNSSLEYIDPTQQIERELDYDVVDTSVTSSPPNMELASPLFSPQKLKTPPHNNTTYGELKTPITLNNCHHFTVNFCQSPHK